MCVCCVCVVVCVLLWKMCACARAFLRQVEAQVCVFAHSHAVAHHMSTAFAFATVATTTAPVSSLSDLTLLKNSMMSIKSSYQEMVQASERIEKKLLADTEALEASKAKFADTNVAIEGALEKFKGRVKLNVGGVRYETTLTTLTADGDESMLGSMFSGRHELQTNDEGDVFLDRDGTHFGHILNLLRESSVAVHFKDRTALQSEIQYHGISEVRCKRLLKVVDDNGNAVCRSAQIVGRL